MAQMFTGLAGACLVAFSTAAAAQTPPPVDPPAEQPAAPQSGAEAPPAQTPPMDQPAAAPAAETAGQAQAGATPAAETAGQAQAGAAAKATAADVAAGASVYDEKGELVGKVDSVTASGAIVSTGKARAEVPLASFGKNAKGLVVSITKAELDAQVKDEKAKADDKPKAGDKAKTEDKPED